MTLTYSIDGAGWATATVSASTGSVKMTASYVHDTLRNLANTVLALDAGQSEGVVVFMDEPGEHHMHLERFGDEVRVRVSWYEGWASWNLYPLDAFETVLTATVSFVELRRATVTVLADVLAKLGIEGYREQWTEHDFPLAEYERLQAS